MNDIDVQHQSVMGALMAQDKDRARNLTIALGSSFVLGTVISLLIVFMAMKGQPWWVKLLVFIVINPPIVGITMVLGFGATYLLSTDPSSEFGEIESVPQQQIELQPQTVTVI